MAEIYQKTPADKTLILGVRESMIYPFQAPNWVDLRLGFFLSLTTAAADDVIPTVGETLTTSGQFQPENRYWIGLKSNDPGMPGASSRFIGFCNGRAPTAADPGNSVLVSSDIGLGTTNSNYWRPTNSWDNTLAAGMLGGGWLLASAADGVQQHFPQSEAGAGGYAVLLGIQLLRSTGTSQTVTVKLKSSGHSGDMLYSSAPTLDLLLSSLQNWPTGVQQLGPVTFSTPPAGVGDALYCYWPFLNSRLRIHAVGFVKAK
jgi:hypothetical protein